MRLVLGSISMVTELAGMTLPQTTTFKSASPLNRKYRQPMQQGAF
jgi:hypothetical protein